MCDVDTSRNYANSVTFSCSENEKVISFVYHRTYTIVNSRKPGKAISE